MRPAEISTHPLQNATGESLSFDLLIWGEKDQNYNAEIPHRHNFHEVLIFTKGGGFHDIDFHTHLIKDHSVHFVAAGNVHLVLRDEESSGCSLLFEKDYLNSISSREDIFGELPFSKDEPLLQLSEDDFFLVEQLITNIKLEYKAQKPNSKGIIHSYMQILLLHWHRIYQSYNGGMDKLPKKSTLINQYLNLVDTHFAEHLQVDQYAERLHISTKHLIEQSKLLTGQTPLQHIHDRTIAEAKRLLFYTELSGKEVAYKLNFEDPSYFTKYFKNHTGYSPVEYRKGIR